MTTEALNPQYVAELIEKANSGNTWAARELLQLFNEATISGAYPNLALCQYLSDAFLRILKTDMSADKALNLTKAKHRPKVEAFGQGVALYYWLKRDEIGKDAAAIKATMDYWSLGQTTVKEYKSQYEAVARKLIKDLARYEMDPELWQAQLDSLLDIAKRSR